MMTKLQHRIYITFFITTGIFAAAYFLILGLEYYTTPLEERFFNPLHNELKPSGFIGHGLGILGSLMMLTGVSSYMLRKRIKKLHRIGVLKHWLEFHIFLCSVGPLLVLYHTAFKFGGIVAVSFWSMVAVVASGVIGRFIYIQIPRTIQGRELSLNEIMQENQSYSNQLRQKYNLSEKLISEIENLSHAEVDNKMKFSQLVPFYFREIFTKKKQLKVVREKLHNEKLSTENIKSIISISTKKITAARKITMLRLMQRLFKYWHVAHLPFAIIMLIIMLVHVGVAIAFGYTWIF